MVFCRHWFTLFIASGIFIPSLNIGVLPCYCRRKQKETFCVYCASLPFLFFLYKRPRGRLIQFKGQATPFRALGHEASFITVFMFRIYRVLVLSLKPGRLPYIVIAASFTVLLHFFYEPVRFPPFCHSCFPSFPQVIVKRLWMMHPWFTKKWVLHCTNEQLYSFCLSFIAVSEFMSHLDNLVRGSIISCFVLEFTFDILHC